MRLHEQSWGSPRMWLVPIGSMYGIFTHIWMICMVNVGIPYMDPMVYTEEVLLIGLILV